MVSLKSQLELDPEPSSRTQVLITFDHQVGLGFTGSGLVDSFAPIDPGIYQLQCGDFKYAGVLTE